MPSSNLVQQPVAKPIFVRATAGSRALPAPRPEPILARTKGVLIFQEQCWRSPRKLRASRGPRQTTSTRNGARCAPRRCTASRLPSLRDVSGPGTDSTSNRPNNSGNRFRLLGLWPTRATPPLTPMCYRSAYMKTHYPAEFFFARLVTSALSIRRLMAEAIRLGIDVRIPHINHSSSMSLRWRPAQARRRSGTRTRGTSHRRHRVGDATALHGPARPLVRVTR